MKRVLVTEPMHRSGMSLLQARPDLEVIQAENTRPQTLARLLPGVQGIAVRVAPLPRDLLARAEALQVVSRHGVGCDNVDVAHLTARGIPVAIAAGANAASVAEHTMALVLATARRLIAQDRAVRDDNFPFRERFVAADLGGAVMLVVGFGRIGRKVAALARAFGMEVVVADIALDRQAAAELGCRGVEDFHPELAKADFITLHVPLDDSTRHLVAAAEFDMMGPGAVLINCARGGVVDEMAMVAALESGHLAAAGLDVYSEEPPSLDSPLLGPLIGRSDVVLTPHSAALSQGALRAMSSMAAQNILDCFDGVLKPACIFNIEGLGEGQPRGRRRHDR